MDRLSMNSKVKQVSPSDSALASDIFDKFCNATTLKTIVGYHRQMCDVLNLRPNHFPSFYPKLRQNVNSWRAKALWKKFDLRASHKCYARGKACPNTRVLIVGAGPCGLRAAIEAQLLGAKVVCVEKRDRMSRNNVLHLWPFVIEDLRALGAKKFFGKFCAGAIDHISIRQLQCILLKVALLLGVEIHTEISFLKLAPPLSKEESQERIGWRGQFSPVEHPVNQYEFDVLIGADGRRNTLEGFRRKEFRGRLAIAITANFINKRTEAEARVEEISGVAFIFNQKFFKDLYEATGIDLENIVYYKDDTHYFVMTAKKQSLLEKGVIINDIADTSKLLGRENVDVDALQNYAREAADFSTQYQMPDLEFAVNHYGNHDVNMFDFTSMYAAENASKVLEKNGHRLLMILVGDSLLEPFWPTGSGCARGFLSSMDACWAIRGWGSGSMTPLEVLSERESIYRLLGQTTPENLQRDSKSYTLDPSTRYPNLNKSCLLPAQVTSLYDTDDPSIISNMITAPPLSINSAQELHKKRRRRDSAIHPDTLLHWIRRQMEQYEDVVVEDLTTSFRDGLILCAVINRYRPDLLDFHALKKEDKAQNNQLAFDILEKELGITPVMTGQEIAENAVPDLLTMMAYLTQIYETFRGEIPHIKHPKLDLSEIKKPEQRPIKVKEFNFASKTNICAGPLPGLRKHRRFEPPHIHHGVSASTDATERKTRKRRSMDKVGASVEERQKRLEEISSNRNERMCRRRQQRKNQTENFIKSMQMLHANAKFEEGGPFEDYSILVYRQTAPNFEDRVKDLEQKLLCADREVKIGNQSRGEKDEDFSGRIKDFEDKLREQAPQEKKPKDLLRAIGKIETTDWNVKEIEKKIIENKIGKSVNKEKEKVPKWSNEQFLARRTKMEKKGLDRQDSEDKKYTAIDKSIRQLDQKLKEGNIRELNQNKVSSITEQFKKQPEAESKPIQKSNSKIIVPSSGGSENCHFCSKRVYLMERLSTEGRFFHRGCFRCQYCNITLRLGSYHFDRDGKYGYKFYCSQHFGMPGQLKVTKTRGKGSKGTHDTPEKSTLRAQRVDTPERIEFANVSPSSEQEESYSPMDEEEWTDRNFGASTAEIGSSDDDSSESGDSDDEAFEEALDEPVTKEGTRRIAKEWVKRYSRERDIEDDSSTEDYDTGSEFSYESSDDDVKDSATEGEEEIRARELRKQEVRLRQPIVPTDTGSDTEVKQFSLLLNQNINHNSSQTFDSPTFINGCESLIPDVLNNDLNESSSLIFLNNSSNNIDASQEIPTSLPDVVSELQNNIVNVNSKPDSEKNGIIDIKIPVRKSSVDSSSLKSPTPHRKLLNSPKPVRKISQDSSKSVKSCSNSPKLTRKLSEVSSSGSAIRNFIKQKSFDQHTAQPYAKPDDQPLLIIKRTPSKINVPKEPQVLAKPRIASLAKIEHAKKFFGDDISKRQIIKRPLLIRTERPKTVIGISMEQKPSEKGGKSKIETVQRPSFEFEPQDDDLKDIDQYIENLLAKEDELLIPIVAPEEPTVEIKETLSESMEDLLKALEIETGTAEETVPEEFPTVETEKLDDLLNWITELEHQPKDQKLFRSYSGVKYKNLESVLKTPKRSESVINRLPKDNITFFERRLSGIVRDKIDSSMEDIGNECRNNFQLTKSQTDVYCNKQPRASVDLEGINIDIKGKLSMFEKKDEEEKPKAKLNKSHSMKSSSVSPARTFTNNKSFIKQLSSNSDDLSDDNSVKTFNGPDNMYFSCQVNCVQTINDNFTGETKSNGQENELGIVVNKIEELNISPETSKPKNSEIKSVVDKIVDLKISFNPVIIEKNSNLVAAENKINEIKTIKEGTLQLEDIKIDNIANISETKEEINQSLEEITNESKPVSLNNIFSNEKSPSEEPDLKVDLKTILSEEPAPKIDLKSILFVDHSQLSHENLKENGFKSINIEPVYATVNKEEKHRARVEKLNLDQVKPQVPQRTKKGSTPSTPLQNGVEETTKFLLPAVSQSRSRDVSPTRLKTHDMKINFMESPIAKSDSNLLESLASSTNSSDNALLQPKVPSRKKSNTSAPSPILSRNSSMVKPYQELELKPELPPRKRTSSYAIRQHGSKELNDAIRAVNDEPKKEEKKIVKANHKGNNKDKDCSIQ